MYNTRAKRLRRVWMFIANIAILVGFGIGYYFLFAAIVDTPAEYEMKRQIAELEQQYKILNERFEFVEEVLNDVEARDRNVFHVLFEAEPYDVRNDFRTSWWNRYESIKGMRNKELGDMLMDSTTSHALKVDLLRQESVYLIDTMSNMGTALNYIPSIQPVINNGLTLLTASYGMRMHPFYKTLSMHEGVDYTVPEGTRVFATADGTVTDITSKSSPTGMSIVISHGNGYETVFNHLDAIHVRKGQSVRKGDIIALSGNTGLSMMPHLHYAIRYKGNSVDPVNYFFMELSPAQYEQIIRIARSGMQSFD